MPEQTREQHQLLGGTALNTAGYFGGFIAALENLYMPAKAEQSNGNHHMSLVNLFDSLMRRVSNTFRGYIYKNSADAANEFSVKPFCVTHRGLDYSHAGSVNLGPLATGVNNIWAVISNTTGTITIGVGTAWPSIPHLRLGYIDMPASGHWLPDDLLPAADRHITPSGTTKFFKKLLHTDTGALDIGRVPANAIVAQAKVFVKTAFNGATPTLKIGDAVDDDRLGETGDFTLATPGLYTATRPYQFTALTTLRSTLSIGGSPSAGELYILMEYWF
ncbi:MAG: hypothetical protein KF841_14115 [Phycisphaerae bacterium]|nr:hypothetical protein [Phycisphaerae bacterium]